MRKKIVAGNWKMNLDLQEGVDLVAAIVDGLPALDEGHQVVIAPPATHLTAIYHTVEDIEFVSIAAQNCSDKESGAYTGEISANMIWSTGASQVIIGHSERREYFEEDNAVLARKTDAALAAGLNVIFCFGEPLEIRDAASHNAYVEKQISEGLFHLEESALEFLVLAYEPIWAIGTGRTASAAQAQDMHAHVRKVVEGKWGAEAAANMSILYGGSCKPSNAAELFACPDVDGGLIGGAALKAEEFLGIISAMKQG